MCPWYSSKNDDHKSPHGLLFFHVFTGCDIVSAFLTIGKVKAWGVWKQFPEINYVFCRCSSPITEIKSEDFALFQRFVVMMFSKGCSMTKVNAARQHLFAHGSGMETIPPTEASLFQHTKRAVLQAGHVWGLGSRMRSPSLPDVTQWGWRMEGSAFVPLWTLLPQASSVCKELPSCGCRKGCNKNCSCFKNTLCCTKVLY